MSAATMTPWGIVAEFDSAAAIYEAAKQTTGAGYSRVDAHTPFPVHGIDSALKHKASGLGFLVICGGITGIVSAQLMMWWMNAVDYPMWVSGKPPYAWEPTIPITFELMVLFSAFCAVFGMLGLNKLPRLHHPIFNHTSIHRVTDDRFFLSIEASDPKFDSNQTADFLRSIGGSNVETIHE